MIFQYIFTADSYEKDTSRRQPMLYFEFPVVG